MGAIFISYRRDDSKLMCDRIHERLVAAFGKKQVFRDIDGIPRGVDFRQTLNTALKECKVALVLIGPKWLAATDDQGRRRLDNPNDTVRIEVETLLQRRIPVIPVLIPDGGIPKEGQLPPEMARLSYQNAAQVRGDPDFQQDVERLIRDLARTVPLSPARRPLLRVAIPAGILVALVLTAALILQTFSPLGSSRGNGGGTPTATSTATTTPLQVSLARRSGSATTIYDTLVSATASCQQGETLVGGGFSNQGGVPIVASYPADGSDWTVTGIGQTPGSATTLTAYADCLSLSRGALGEQISRSQEQGVELDGATHPYSQACPAGTHLTGGGFLGTWPPGPVNIAPNFVVLGSNPDTSTNSGWVVSIQAQISMTVQVFAMCATQEVTGTDIQAKALQSDGGTIPCASSSEYLADGGYTFLSTQYGAVAVTEDGPADPEFSSWSISSTGSAGRNNVTAVCLTISS